MSDIPNVNTPRNNSAHVVDSKTNLRKINKHDSQSQAEAPVRELFEQSPCEQSIADCICEWQHLDDEDKAGAFDLLIERWGAPCVVAACARKYDDDWPLFCDYIKGSQILEPKKRSIKTIGTYYHRIRNGGTERVISELMSIWLSLNYRVVLFTLEDPSDDDYFVDERVIRVTLPDSTNKPEFTKEEAIEAREQTLQSAINDYGIDLFVHHAQIDKRLLWDAITIKAQGVPVVVYSHSIFGFLVIDPLLLQAIYAAYSLLDGVITLSSANCAFWGAVCRRAWLIQNPVDSSLLSVGQANLDNQNIVWVGRLNTVEKRMFDLLEIMRRVTGVVPEATLTIVGAADSEAELADFKRGIVENGLENNIVLTGYQLDVTEYYLDASVFIMTSASEGLPISLLESKATGLPCVMYDIPGIDLLSSAQGIKKIRRFSLTDFANAVLNLLLDKRERHGLGQEARISFERYASFDQQTAWKNIATDVISVDSRAERANVPLSEHKAIIEQFMEMCVWIHGLHGQEKNALINDLHQLRERLGTPYNVLLEALAPEATRRRKLLRWLKHGRSQKDE
ncbi:MAG: glycosyltransferase [Coriobacteriales bacterium]|jgi:glycosyltransferase involved in cell wall biosynthesis|nr:glycosyltransferase [Coriobacteriales bacterium]